MSPRDLAMEVLGRSFCDVKILDKTVPSLL
jgi:hypothetical protein